MAKAVKLPNVRIVDRASLPYQPSFPNLPLNLAIGVVLGLGTGLLGALWREHADDRLWDRQEVEDSGIPVLTMVPRIRGPVAQVVGAEGGATAILPPGDNGDSRSDRVAEEAFRSLAFELEIAGRRLAEENLLIRVDHQFDTWRRQDVLRLQPGGSGSLVGKAHAPDRCRCPCARRRPVAQTGQGSYGPGRGAQRGGADPDVAIQQISVGGGCSLDVLQAGEYLRRSAWLLSPRLQTLIDLVSAKYDLVLIDTPPLNVLSDAAQVASAVDGVVVVVRGGVTGQRHGLELTMQRLERAGGRVIGVVLNDVELPDYYTSYSGVADDVG